MKIQNADLNKESMLTIIIYFSNMTSNSRELYILMSLKMYDDVDG